MIKFTALRPLRQEEWAAIEQKLAFFSLPRVSYLLFIFLLKPLSASCCFLLFLIPYLCTADFSNAEIWFSFSRRAIFLFTFSILVSLFFFLAASAIRKLSWFNLVPSELLLFVSVVFSIFWLLLFVDCASTTIEEKMTLRLFKRNLTHVPFNDDFCSNRAAQSIANDQFICQHFPFIRRLTHQSEIGVE